MTKTRAEASYQLGDFFTPPALVAEGRFIGLDEANATQSGALVYCQTLQYFEAATRNPNVTAIIATPSLANKQIGKGLVAADDPRRAFFILYNELRERLLSRPAIEDGVGQECVIHGSAIISPRARIGNHVEIDANAIIGDGVVIADGCYIGPNAVVGAEGLLTVRHDDGTLLRVKHSGGVQVGAHVEVLAGAVIARSLFRSPTRLGDYSQIGIMANIGHGASIGQRCVVSGNSVIAGRAVIGDDVWIGTSCSVAQGLVVGQGAQIKMGSVVASNVAPRQAVSGNWAVDHTRHMRDHFRIRGLKR